MNISNTYFVNRNTGNVTTNLSNTIVEDEEKVPYKDKYCAYGITEVESAEKRIAANMAELPYKGETKLNRMENSIDYGKGATIRLKAGYSIELNASGWQVNYGDPDNIEADQYAQSLATDMSNLLKYAEYQFQHPTAMDSQLEAWSKNVIDGLSKSGIDTTKVFTVNGMEFKVDKGIVRSTAQIKADQDAKDAYNLSLVQNKTFESCSESMKNNIDYYFQYYCTNVPESFQQAWYKAMEECNVNPFANNSSAVPKLSYEMDVETSGKKEIFGSTLESAKEGIMNALNFLDQRGSMDKEYDEKQKKFFENLLEKI